MILKEVYTSPTFDWSRKFIVSFDIEARDFSYDRATNEFDFTITQPMIVSKYPEPSKLEYELLKLADSILDFLVKNNPQYIDSLNDIRLAKVNLEPYFEKPDVVDSTARDVTNVRFLNEADT